MPLELEDLSHDATEHVAKQLNPADILELSSVSDDWDRLLKSFKMSISEFYVSLRGLSEDEPGLAHILFGLKPFQKSFIHFFFYKKTEEELKEIEKDPKTTFKILNGDELMCQRSDAVIKIFTSDPVESFFSVMDHLLLLFPGSVHHVQIAFCNPTYDPITFRILKAEQIKLCSKLTLPISKTISNELVNLVFSLPKLYVFNFHCSTSKKLTHYKPVHIRHLYICFAEWVTRRSLFCFNCETIDLGDPRVSLKDLNAFMKKWLEEDSKVLRRFQASYCHGWKWEHEKTGGKDLFDGISWEKWDPKKSSRPRKFYSKESQEIDMIDGRDIRRGDGALASVKCDKYKFLFVVFSYPE
ncbi:unnamed protein product [Caenorhabditis brenneri]